MSTVTENDLRELKDLINSKFDKVDSKFEKLSDDVNSIKVDIAILKEGQNSLNQRIDDVNKRIDDTQTSINKRLDNLDFLARTVIGGVVLALLAGLAKLLYPNLIN